MTWTPERESRYQEMQEEAIAHPEEYKKLRHKPAREWPNYWQPRGEDEGSDLDGPDLD